MSAPASQERVRTVTALTCILVLIVPALHFERMGQVGVYHFYKRRR